MTKTEKQIELAKLDGKEIRPDEGLFVIIEHGIYKGTTTKEKWLVSLPDYTQYNNILPLIQKQDSVTLWKIVHHLLGLRTGASISYHDIQRVLLKQPDQLSDALLMAHNLL